VAGGPQRAGFRTGLFGKWHLGTRDEFHPTSQGYDQFIGMRHGAAKPIGPTMEIDGKDQVVPGAVAEILVEKAGEFIEANRTRPFLASIHFREPHAPYAPVPEQDSAAVRDLTIAVPDYPGLDRKRATRLMREYLASVHLIDRTVGKLLDRITALGLDGNTIIVFTSDHGYMIGHHGLLHKGNGNWILEGRTDRRPNMFDDAIRVPLLIHWPGVTREGQVIERVVSNLDLFPTLLAMARVDVPASVVISGQNLGPMLRGAAWPRADVLFGQYDMHHGTRASMRMLRTPERKLILHFEPGAQDELYDLKRDPGETANLVPAGGELPRGYKDILNDLIARMRAIQDPRTSEAELRARSFTSAPAPKT
jgi:uncharacterized sulfatase